MKKICIIIRVYSRISDLEVCLWAIKNYWKLNDYYIIISSNGKSAGYEISEEIKKMAHKVVELEENVGHSKGNSQLVREGVKYIPKDCEFTVLLEADTWVFTDLVINKYIEKLIETKKDWASADWIGKKWSLGIDIAICRNSYIDKNPELFNYGTSPESVVCNYLRDNGGRFIYIEENEPVHVPKTIRKIYNADKGRIRFFPKAKMVTHHIEDLKGGIEEKKEIANICCQENIFGTTNKWKMKLGYMKMKFLILLVKITPKSSWVKKKKTQTVFD